MCLNIHTKAKAHKATFWAYKMLLLPDYWMTSLWV